MEWTCEKVHVFNFHVFFTRENRFSDVITCKSSHDIFTISQHYACEIFIENPLFFTRMIQMLCICDCATSILDENISLTPINNIKHKKNIKIYSDIWLKIRTILEKTLRKENI